MNQSTKQQLWAKVIEQYSQSELSAAAFCRVNQITTHTFYYWHKKLKRSESEPTIHPVVIDDQSTYLSAQLVTLTLPTGITAQLPADLPFQIPLEPVIYRGTCL